MATTEDIVMALRDHQAALRLRYPIQRMALFGSWARGDAREDSDVDILVEVDPSIGLRFVELGDELEKALGRRVDLVSRRAIKEEMWERIESELVDA
ncbi:MAG TPA: nucleotidyltransferase family protein [Thermoanaerobaculia bacterium]|jgi:predicted nucleotidyltransferase|nr:nucleotidyltransferase family protein [Thermoanaerobaculia bacterium]